MRIFIDAYDAQGQRILGNLDGQASLGSPAQYRRTTAYKTLRSGENRPKFIRVKEWKVMRHSGHGHEVVLETIPNPHFQENAT